MAGLGLLRLWRPAVVYACLAALTPAALWALRRLPSESGPADEPWSLVDAALAASIAAFLALNLLGAMIPEIFYDALNYHLALPDIYWRHHGFIPVFENAFSGVPMLGQMLFALALPVGGDRLAHLVNLSFGVLCALAVYDFGRRFAGRRTGLLAAALFYANPLVCVNSWKAAVDLPTALYGFLALYAASLAVMEAGRMRQDIALAGAFAGLSMSTKYQAYPLAVILTIVLGLKLAHSNRATALRLLGVFAAAATAAFAIWPLRDLLLYGNPLFPFLQERVAPRGPAFDWHGLLADGGRDWSRLFSSWAGLRELAASPWQLTTQQLDTRSFGPVALLGLPLLFLARFRRPAERLLLPCALALWALWSATTTVPRYFLPAFLVACALFASAFEGALGARAKRAGYLLIGGVILMNFAWTLAWFKTYEADDVVFGVEKASDYLSRTHPSYGFPYYGCAAFINARLPPDARVMTVGDERSHYIERDAVATTFFAEHPLDRALRGCVNAAELRAALLRDGITHVLVNEAKIRAIGLDHVTLDSRRAAVLRDFEAGSMRLLFEYPPRSRPPECAVYEIAR
jgi:4-amino-4-deoxy-L-arabinose transferase-like glycosyltransferase